MNRLKVQEVIAFLETIAPKSLQESYDNSGLLLGNSESDVSGILTTLDCTEAVIEEAIQRHCNLIVSHHPIIFKGLKKITAHHYIERAIIKAIKNDIAIYAIHTNLDNVLKGVNQKIAEKIGLINTRILVPKNETLLKLVTFVPLESKESVLKALFRAGAGNIGNYKDCSFVSSGVGSFLPTESANPAIGSIGKLEEVAEQRIEVILPRWAKNAVLKTLKDAHPYEEIAYYLTNLENEQSDVGSGLIGELLEAEEPFTFLRRLKKDMDLNVVKYTSIISKSIKKVAVCGGSGSFLLQDAIRAKADIYLSADFKYHEFFDADQKIIVADIGHYESEQHTKELLQEVLSKKFPTFAINFSNTPTNPISYL